MNHSTTGPPSPVKQTRHGVHGILPAKVWLYQFYSIILFSNLWLSGIHRCNRLKFKCCQTLSAEVRCNLSDIRLGHAQLMNTTDLTTFPVDTVLVYQCTAGQSTVVSFICQHNHSWKSDKEECPCKLYLYEHVVSD